ncbi:hypothetical protein A8H39_09900 [Paraburkholderia fungorum]|uniref:hypothetical protein n=1 Tax=Paraburkholderia fungorum TaxID=134537 RepID=UPI00048941F4|nr:hypothetical protein [Paraburkholderia fungorum]MBB5543537.1 hypothetical protein [Paraburkholderia fungorum]PNE56138.1 hypothetical protein A8H39_09900 [Paraburkholderia fungorum]
MQAWESVLIKADSKHPDAGRAGLIQAVDKEKETVSVKLDADANNKEKFVTANFDDVQRLG